LMSWQLVNRGTLTKNANLHRDENKKHNHQNLKFKTYSFHLYPHYVLSLFFISAMPTLS